MATLEREYEEVNFDKPIAPLSTVTVHEFLTMSDDKRKETLAALGINTPRAYVTKCKNTFDVLFKTLNIEKAQ